MPDILAVETSAESCSVAVNGPNGIIELFEHAPMKHAELLLPMVESLLASLGKPLVEFDAIAFGRGPGSFTSLRIGIGVVQGLAWGAQLPVVPVSSLAAVAQSALTSEGLDTLEQHHRLVVAMDARMDEVYWSEFDRLAPALIGSVATEQVSAPQALIEGLGDDSWIAVGNGFERYEALASAANRASSVHPGVWPRASAVLKLAEHWMTENDPLDAQKAQPVYLRNQVTHKPRTTTKTSPGR